MGTSPQPGHQQGQHLILWYDEIFDGVVLAYDVYSFDKCAKILPGVYPYFGVNLKLNLLLFSPKPDMLLEGKVVKLTHESIHVVVLGFASAIITEKDIRAEFVYKMKHGQEVYASNSHKRHVIKVGTTIQFLVKSLEAPSKVHTHILGKDLKDSRVLTDVGDVPIQEIRDCGVDDKRLMSVIGESVKLVMEEAPLRPLVLGGDHSISFPVIRAVSEKLGGPVDVLHIDAHPDNYDAFEGNIYSHASSFARVMEGDYVRRLLQVGIRSITAEGRAQAKVKYHKETSIDSTISYLGFKIKDKINPLNNHPPSTIFSSNPPPSHEQPPRKHRLFRPNTSNPKGHTFTTPTET
ncbi:unnamed protein product [Vicia faba]|uniref:Uncharacterized protein n=1 Tax=Vicia faba TaxID=3906 RepID=A0AAV0YY34_VICFA|nr:unnamed protein product [Vicia faba]